MSAASIPDGRRPKTFDRGRLLVYAVLVLAAAFFLTPLWIMMMTSFKSMAEIRDGQIFSWPQHFTVGAWFKAWSSACTGLTCDGVQVGFWNSIRILVPSVILSIALGGLTGYAMTFYRVPGANFLFAILLIGAFIPYQVFIYPMVRVFSVIGIYDSLTGIVVVHIIFGLSLMTLLFRNYFSALPIELFNAARVDGAGFLTILRHVILPMSAPIIIVATILQVTGIWNDFILGLTFAGRTNRPMTVLLNNIVNSTQGEAAYDVDMAATILTALVPLVVYFASGRWFVRGVAAGAVKG
ncbi:MAG: carbohydrate ABC transporter permease [Planctomycetaceae bacterium]|nr:carbohydrate ABC transporter permease [Planctomycetaceae bacterium]